MIGEIKRSDGTTNIFPFIIQKIEEILESDKDIKDIDRRLLETELAMLKKIDGVCDIPEIGRTVEEVKDDIEKYRCIFLSPYQYKLFMRSSEMITKIKNIRDTLNDIFDEETY